MRDSINTLLASGMSPGSRHGGAGATSEREEPSAPAQLSIAQLVREHPKTIVALIAAGVIAYALNAFLGYRDGQEPAALSTVFHAPWPLFLWYCALILTLQFAILRGPTLRRPLLLTVGATLAAIIFVVVVYVHGTGTLLQRLSDLLTFLLGTARESALTYTLLNFGIMAIFWAGTLVRWRRRWSGLAPNPHSREDMPSKADLVAGDLIAGFMLASVLAVVTRAENINVVIDLGAKWLRWSVPHVSYCTLSWPAVPAGYTCGPHGGAGVNDPPTLFFLNLVQVFSYLALGMLILATSVALDVFGKDTKQAEEAVEAARKALQTGLNRQLSVAVSHLSEIGRDVAWCGAILASVIGVGIVAYYNRDYLHLVSAKWTCEAGYSAEACRAAVQDFTCTHKLWEFGLCIHQGLGISEAKGLQFPLLAVALTAAAISALAISWAISLVAHNQVTGNVPRFVAQIGFTLVVTLPFFSVFFIAVNQLLLLFGVPRNPFHWPPGVMTTSSALLLLLFGLIVQRLKRGQQG